MKKYPIFLKSIGESFLKIVFKIVKRLLKILLIGYGILYVLATILDYSLRGEVSYTNRIRIVTRLEKEAFPLIEKYHVTWVGKKAICYVTKLKGVKEQCINFSKTPLDKTLLTAFKKIRNISLSNALWEHDFREARIEFNSNNIESAEFYFNCFLCYEWYVYNKTPFFLEKNVHSHFYINPHWHLEDGK